MKMSHSFCRIAVAMLFVSMAGGFASVRAEDAVKVRLGTLVPKGSSYFRILQELGESWRAVQGQGSTFVIYGDGSQGGEADMVKRMRVGQLNAALLSAVGLAEIESLPAFSTAGLPAPGASTAVASSPLSLPVLSAA